jgi:hypothetical protein
MRRERKSNSGAAVRSKRSDDRSLIRAAALTGGGLPTLRLAGRKRARAFVPRANVEPIEHPEVEIARNLQAPKQSEAEGAADAADDLQRKLAAAQRLDANFDRCFFFRVVHQRSE